MSWLRLRDHQLLPVVVDPEVAQQRLGVLGAPSSVLNAGLKSAVRLVVDCLLLLSVTASAPPPHRMFWVRPPFQMRRRGVDARACRGA